MKKILSLIVALVLISFQAQAGPPITQGINKSDMGAISASSITDTGLTSGRVPIAGTGGLLGDDADLTFSTDTLTATKFSGALNGTVGATTPAAGTFTLVTIGGTKYLTSTSSVLDDGTVALPTVTATTGALYGVVLVSSAGIVDANATFIADATGTVTLQITGGSVVANADTDGNLCIGTAVANPLTVKNRLGGTKTVTIITWYN